jgi:molybdate transport system substrate-binding protein
MNRSARVGCAMLVAIVSGVACGGTRAARTTMVFAAASLTAPFEALAKEFERQHAGVEVQLQGAGTPQLVLQLREGAHADVFASADETNMQRVVAAGLTAGVPQTFARNRLAIVVAAGNPQSIHALADLPRAGLRVALCAAEVPAGRYARQALAKAGVALLPVSDEPSVKAVVSKVQLGELDAGIVYRTDVRVAGVAEVAIDPAHDVVAVYPIVVSANGREPLLGAEFVRFVQSGEGQRLLAGFGFLSP